MSQWERSRKAAGGEREVLLFSLVAQVSKLSGSLS